MELKLKDIEGLGPANLKKLKDSGIVTVQQLAVSDPTELSIRISCTKESATKYIQNSLKLINGNIESDFMSADKILEKRKQLNRISTGSKDFDEFLLGGIETQSVTEVYGEFGSGKSQLCYTLCVMAQQPIENGGLDSGVIYIDTEGTFRPERLLTIAEARGVPFDLSRVMGTKMSMSANLELIVRDLAKYIDQFKARLIIVDSIISLHRSDYAGRGTLAERQQRLNTVMHHLLRTAEMYNVAVVITNQVTSDPGQMFGDPIKPVGGNVIGHSATYRIYLKKHGKTRVARMVDSPYHEAKEVKFTVTTKGVDDVEDEK